MEEAIKSFARQFEYEPIIENESEYKKRERFIVSGMGGSHLAAGIIKNTNPHIDITIHKDYGLPALADKKLQESTFIASSYSGNTEEVLSALEEALEKKMSSIVIATGGTLIQKAKEHNLPYIEIPQTNIQPRSALGFSFRALLKAIGLDDVLKETQLLKNNLKPDELHEQGKILAEKLKGSVPIIYASRVNEPLAYNWKIKFNETGKIPAFYNVFPELNHNEMTAFDVKDSSKALSENFSFIFLKDSHDNPRITKRMDILETQLKERDFGVHILELAGETIHERIFSSLLLGDWTALETARIYGLESEKVPMIEEFKKKISS